MKFSFKHGVATAMAFGTVLLANAGAASAVEHEPSAPEGVKIVLNDGTVVGMGETVTFTFTEDPSKEDVVGPQREAPCDAVKDPATYTVKGTPYFLADKDKPQSTWLLPNQKVSWAVSGAHTFTWDISGGVETEAGIILAKAKVKIDTKISNSWTWNSTQTVEDTNKTKKGYRAVLGAVGWKLTSVKEWVQAPCKTMKKKIIVKSPREGDLSIGRETS